MTVPLLAVPLSEQEHELLTTPWAGYAPGGVPAVWDGMHDVPTYPVLYDRAEEFLAALDAIPTTGPQDLYESIVALMVTPLEPGEEPWDRWKQWQTEQTARLQQQCWAASSPGTDDLQQADLLPTPSLWALGQAVDAIALHQVIQSTEGGWQRLITTWGTQIASIPLPAGMRFAGVEIHRRTDDYDVSWASPLVISIQPRIKLFVHSPRDSSILEEGSQASQAFDRVREIEAAYRNVCERLLLADPAVAAFPVAQLLLERLLRNPEIEWPDEPPPIEEMP